MTEKMTYVQALNAALEMYSAGGQVDKEDAEVVEKLTALRDSIAKKNASRTNKPTPKQKANAELMTEIYEAMEGGKAYTVTEIGQLVPALADAKVQKVSALVTKMRENVLVAREVVKGRAYFTKI